MIYFLRITILYSVSLAMFPTIAFAEPVDSFFTYEASVKVDHVANLSGGQEQRSGTLANFDLLVGFDLEKLLGVSNLKFNAYLLGDIGDDPTEFVGDSFASSSIEAPDAVKLYEAYLEKGFGKEWSAKLGTRDLNAEFNALDSAGVFLNGSFGISPSISQTGINGPSIFPTTALAALVGYTGKSGIYSTLGSFNARAGDPNRYYSSDIYTGDKNGYLLIGEFGYKESDDLGKYGFGYWKYTKASDPINAGDSKSENSGAYFIGERKLLKDLTVFFKYGQADAKLNTFKSTAEFGATYSGICKQFKKDTLALGASLGQVSSDYVELESSAEHEQLFEIAYRMELNDHIALTPDFQYVVHPGLALDVTDAVVGALRFEYGF